ncbi:MAG: alpha-mannosidase [Chloroflexota bacterium]
MLLTYQKLSRRAPEIIAAAVRDVHTVEGVLWCPAPGLPRDSAMAPAPPPDHPAWTRLRPRQQWGGAPGDDPYAAEVSVGWGIPTSGGGNHWLMATVQVPEQWRGKQVLAELLWEKGQHTRVEGIAYLDGQALSGVDHFHLAAVLPTSAHTGTHELLLRLYVPYAIPFDGLRLVLRDEGIFRFGQRFAAMLDAIPTYLESAPERLALTHTLNNAYNMLDLREGWQSERFAASAYAALDFLEAASDHELKRPEPAAGEASEVMQPRVVSTGHAHLDVAWLWPLWRTRQKVAHTVANALHLMERYPEYRFSMSQPQVYDFLKHDDPQLYARLKKAVAEGRIEPVGMMWLEVDCNIASGESLVRQLSFGARYFAEEFGDINHVVWLPDVFGYSAALPQLMRSCGISCFMTTKISWNQFNRIPVDTFRWRGIDGTEVLAHFVTATSDPLGHPADPQSYTYNGHMTAAEVTGLWKHYRQKDVNNELLYLYGYGDGGGGPTEEMLETARLFEDLPGFPQIVPGRVDDYFKSLYERVWDNPDLPTWVGELYLELHRGTYTSQARNKQANRASELLYREAEWLNAWASTLGAANRQPDLNEGWKLILLNQFHDILPGSSIAPVYVESQQQYAEVQRIGQDVSMGAASVIAASGEAAAESGDKSGFAVFNSLPWERNDALRMPLTPGMTAQSLSDDGARLTQVVEEVADEQSLLVEIDTPSYGYSVLTTNQTTQPDAEATRADTSVKRTPTLVAQRTTLQNDELRLELDDNGEIASLYDLRCGREVIAEGQRGNRLVAYEDRPLAWEAWDVDIFYEEKPYPVQDIADWRIAEEGPVRAAVEITRKLGSSTIRQRICLWRSSRRVDFITEIDWQERQTLLRALFPLGINASRATCEIQFGAVERPTHRNTSWDMARFEVPAHRWVDLSEGNYGVALLNDGKYGHSLHDNVLGLSLLKGAIFPDPNADRGIHRFTYSLLPHAGDWREAQVVRRAYELNAPLRAVPVQRTHAVERVSFLSTPSDHIVIETVKVAEDGDGLIIRLYEAHNQRGHAVLRFLRPVTRAEEVDLLERKTVPVDVEGGLVSLDIRPFEVKTLRVWL